MIFIDFIRNLFSNGKKNVNIISKDFNKFAGDTNPLEVALYCNKEPLINKIIRFNVNSKDYNRSTDNDGIARLNINLPAGEYKVKLYFDGDDEYNNTNSVINVTVKDNLKFTRMEGTDIIMSKNDGTKYQCAVYDENNNRLDCDVTINVNGKNYNRSTDSEGLAKLNINLPVGDYKIIANYHGSSVYKPSIVTNTLHINPEKSEETRNHFGYWVFGKDMLNTNLQDLKNNGVTDLFLNYYAFETHGESKVLLWIKEAKNIGINIHIWMQSFYDGEWHNPKETDLNYKIEEARKYASLSDVYGIHLDYLRYPGNAYKTSGGTEAVTQFVKDVKNVIGSKFLSCAVMPEQTDEYYYGQDIGELGKLCDAILPMQYKGNYGAGTSWLASTTQLFSSQATVWSGLQSYKSDDDASVLSGDELRNDVQTCLDNGASGVIIFRYGLSSNIKF
jgi:hypothetical protein